MEKNKFSGWVLIFGLLFLSGSSFADDFSPDSAESKERIGVAEQFGRDLTSPIRGDGRTALLVGSGLTLLAYPFRNDVLAVGRNQPLGSASSTGYQLGLWKINLAYVVGSLGYGWIAANDEAIRKSVLMIRATAYTGILTTGIKELHFEERPRKNGDMNSFPSGHASNVFAFAGVISRNHGLLLGVPALALASFVSFSRLNDNAHYLHDVIFGGTLGLSYAFGLDSEWRSSDHSKSVALVPLISYEVYGVGAVVDF